MGEIEGTYRVLQTAGTRLGAQTPLGVSTLEPGQTLLPGPQEKRVHIGVELLDSTVEVFDIEPKCAGQGLLMRVWKHLNLIECDYFGLEFQNVPSCWIWLEPMKPIIRQVRRPKNAVLRLAVKFFPPDPGQLQEEYTRYLFALQVKRDLMEERLTCAASTAALLASHLLQAEIGDYDETLDREHLKAHEYLPSQQHSLEKILDFHRRHIGQTPAESDFQVLEIARKLEMYGIRFYPASDREGTKISLAVSHMGVLVFQGITKINTFNWSKVRKLSFKRKRFLIKLHPEVHDSYQDTLEFLLGSRDECKSFWKICVEYHTFFRLLDQPKPKAKAVLFSRGSSFRYSGRTQKQLVEYVKDGGVKRIPYERRYSKTRMSVRALTADLPKQSISVTEGVRTCAFLSSADASCYLFPTSPLAPPGPPSLKDSSSSIADAQGPDVKHTTSERSSRAATGGPSMQLAHSPGPPELQSGPGVGLCPIVSHQGSVCPKGQSPSTLSPGAWRASAGLQVAGNSAGDGFPAGSFASWQESLCGQQCHSAGPDFILTNAQLQVSEEFIDDDPADISFFAGGSEAFSFPHSSLVPLESQATAQCPVSSSLCGPDVSLHLESATSSPDRFSTEAVDMSVEDGFEFGDGSDLSGDTHTSDTEELLEVKARACLAQSLGRPAETNSLSDAPLHGRLSLHTASSASQSEASSMVNFPAYSVRSESSSAFQFSDIIDQLEQLSYPPTAAEDSSSTDTSSWDSEAEAPLDVSLFFSNPFAQTHGERVPLKSSTPGEQMDKNPS